MHWIWPLASEVFQPYPTLNLPKASCHTFEKKLSEDPLKKRFSGGVPGGPLKHRSSTGISKTPNIHLAPNPRLTSFQIVFPFKTLNFSSKLFLKKNQVEQTHTTPQHKHKGSHKKNSARLEFFGLRGTRPGVFCHSMHAMRSLAGRLLLAQRALSRGVSWRT